MSHSRSGPMGLHLCFGGVVNSLLVSGRGLLVQSLRTTFELVVCCLMTCVDVSIPVLSWR